eukprot:TRINITY_DN45428_c0_g1_i2.p1 TRINITY_DN45428_c0_g1~~TRINITY_DN45428_c0_g1_i2.p1  ORF type:complete len:1650 (+),score=376.57 TRINITY_DN45428_c0_g1_i2:177-5126(+)
MAPQVVCVAAELQLSAKEQVLLASTLSSLGTPPGGPAPQHAAARRPSSSELLKSPLITAATRRCSSPAATAASQATSAEAAELHLLATADGASAQAARAAYLANALAEADAAVCKAEGRPPEAQAIDNAAEQDGRGWLGQLLAFAEEAEHAIGGGLGDEELEITALPSMQSADVASQAGTEVCGSFASERLAAASQERQQPVETTPEIPEGAAERAEAARKLQASIRCYCAKLAVCQLQAEAADTEEKRLAREQALLERAAITVIKAACRRHAARQQVRRTGDTAIVMAACRENYQAIRRESAKTIQSMCRRYIAVWQVLYARTLPRRAAVRIQSFWRGQMARRVRNAYALYKEQRRAYQRRRWMAAFKIQSFYRQRKKGVHSADERRQSTTRQAEEIMSQASRAGSFGTVNLASWATVDLPAEEAALPGRRSSATSAVTLDLRQDEGLAPGIGSAASLVTLDLRGDCQASITTLDLRGGDGSEPSGLSAVVANPALLDLRAAGAGSIPSTSQVPERTSEARELANGLSRMMQTLHGGSSQIPGDADNLKRQQLEAWKERELSGYREGRRKAIVLIQSICRCHTARKELLRRDVEIQVKLLLEAERAVRLGGNSPCLASAEAGEPVEPSAVPLPYTEQLPPHDRGLVAQEMQQADILSFARSVSSPTGGLSPPSIPDHSIRDSLLPAPPLEDDVPAACWQSFRPPTAASTGEALPQAIYAAAPPPEPRHEQLLPDSQSAPYPPIKQATDAHQSFALLDGRLMPAPAPPLWPPPPSSTSVAGASIMPAGRSQRGAAPSRSADSAGSVAARDSSKERRTPMLNEMSPPMPAAAPACLVAGSSPQFPAAYQPQRSTASSVVSVRGASLATVGPARGSFPGSEAVLASTNQEATEGAATGVQTEAVADQADGVELTSSQDDRAIATHLVAASYSAAALTRVAGHATWESTVKAAASDRAPSKAVSAGGGRAASSEGQLRVSFAEPEASEVLEDARRQLSEAEQDASARRVDRPPQVVTAEDSGQADSGRKQQQLAACLAAATYQAVAARGDEPCELTQERPGVVAAESRAASLGSRRSRELSEPAADALVSEVQEGGLLHASAQGVPTGNAPSMKPAKTATETPVKEIQGSPPPLVSQGQGASSREAASKPAAADACVVRGGQDSSLRPPQAAVLIAEDIATELHLSGACRESSEHVSETSTAKVGESPRHQEENVIGPAAAAEAAAAAPPAAEEERKSLGPLPSPQPTFSDDKDVAACIAAATYTAAAGAEREPSEARAEPFVADVPAPARQIEEPAQLQGDRGIEARMTPGFPCVADMPSSSEKGLAACVTSDLRCTRSPAAFPAFSADESPEWTPARARSARSSREVDAAVVVGDVRDAKPTRAVTAASSVVTAGSPRASLGLSTTLREFVAQAVSPNGSASSSPAVPAAATAAGYQTTSEFASVITSSPEMKHLPAALVAAAASAAPGSSPDAQLWQPDLRGRHSQSAMSCASSVVSEGRSTRPLSKDYLRDVSLSPAQPGAAPAVIPAVGVPQPVLPSQQQPSSPESVGATSVASLSSAGAGSGASVRSAVSKATSAPLGDAKDRLRTVLEEAALAPGGLEEILGPALQEVVSSRQDAGCSPSASFDQERLRLALRAALAAPAASTVG